MSLEDNILLRARLARPGVSLLVELQRAVPGTLRHDRGSRNDHDQAAAPGVRAGALAIHLPAVLSALEETGVRSAHCALRYSGATLRLSQESPRRAGGHVRPGN